jgi:hypothetical protein
LPLILSGLLELARCRTVWLFHAEDQLQNEFPQPFVVLALLHHSESRELRDL